MIGKLLTYIVFVLAAGATATYFMAYARQSVKLQNTGRMLYYGVTGGLIIISMFFLSLILSHSFEYTYIWQYSSRELPLYYLVAAFYSGQEGSFLLWSLLLALVGFFLIPYAKKKGYEPLVMGLYSIILVFLLLMIIVKSPFNFVWETFAGDGVMAGFVPPNGRGLNPVLQNYWITIHPPILFIGYAAMTVPYAFALAGLIKKDYQNWINIAIPWTLFGTAILGLGIMLGGFWAYETLGWGGFWGWDPVENSSLIPWLVAVALVHTMLVHRKTGGLIKTNFFLSVMAFVLVLYATFLTRSGILGDTSVHSFVDPGKIVYTLLMGLQVLFFVFGIAVLLWRLKDLPGGNSDFKFSSREFFVSLGAIVILMMAVIILGGTSYPIFSEIFGYEKASIDISFYNIWNLPLAIVMLMLISVSLYLSWKSSNFMIVLKKSLYTAIMSIVAIAILFAMGVREPKYLLLAFAGFFALLINIDFFIRKISKKPRSTGSYISHAGVAMLLIGALASGAYSNSERVKLHENESKEVLGYKITYLNKDQIEQQYSDREKFKYNIKIEKDGKEQVVHPIVYWSDFNNREAPFFEPGIARMISRDLYISPNSVETSTGAENATLIKNQTTKVPGDSYLKMSLQQFDMSKSMTADDQQRVKLGAVVKFEKPDWQQIDTLWVYLNMATGETEPVWYKLPGIEKEVGFMYLLINEQNMAMSKALFYFKDAGMPLPEPVEVFTFEASTKPFINLVWIGTIALVAGFFVAIARYSVDKKNTESENTKPEKVLKEEAL